MLRFRKRLHAWLAIFATLIGALAPSVSRAMASGEQALLLDICSASGVHQIVLTGAEADLYAGLGLPGAGDADGESSDLSFSACPYCFTHAGSVGLPGFEATPSITLATGGDLLPPLFLSAPRTLFAWSPSHPRAPPAFL
jgi:hypothetical protein